MSIEKLKKQFLKRGLIEIIGKDTNGNDIVRLTEKGEKAKEKGKRRLS